MECENNEQKRKIGKCEDRMENRDIYIYWESVKPGGKELETIIIATMCK